MDIYTDGSSDVGKKLIGYAAYDGEGNHIVSGWRNGEGSNTAELTAIYESLFRVPNGTNVTFHVDSNNVIGWLMKDWKSKALNIKELLHNIELRKNLHGILISVVKTEGHSGVWQNELADKKAAEMLNAARKAAA